ncbi:hypothetical protein COOONC_04140 [Cooperia oncophora]
MKAALFLLLIGVTVTVLCRKKHHHHHPVCHTPPPKPTFLKNVGCKARAEYYDIMFKWDEKIGKIEEEIAQWAKKYQVVEQLEKFNNRTEKFREELKHNVTTLVAELPKAVEKFLNITQNKNVTRKEMTRQLRDMEKENFELFGVVKSAFLAFKPHHCPHHHDSISSEEIVDNFVDDSQDDEGPEEDFDPVKELKIMKGSSIFDMF